MQPPREPTPDPVARSTNAYEGSPSAHRKTHPLEPRNATIEHYDVGSMLLHWTVALLVLLVGLTSLFIDDTRSDKVSIMLRTFHFAAGTIAFGLVLVWFVWRATRDELTNIPNIGTIERRVVAGMNGAINALLFLVPVTGLLYAFAIGKRIELGVTTLAFDLSLSERNAMSLGLTHNILCKALLTLAVLHSLYGLWHHFKRRDRLLRRMLPWH